MNKKIYKGEYVSLFLEEKGGKTREKVYLRDSVNIVLVDIKKRIYLINESRWDKNNEKVMKLLSGLVEEKEHPSVCAKREILEEAGISDVKLRKIFTYNDAGTINQNRYYYIAYIKNEKDIDLNILCKFSRRKLEQKIKQNFFGLSTTGAILRILQKIS